MRQTIKHYHGWTQFKKNITEFKLNCLLKSNQCCLLWFRVEYTALTQAKHEEECFITYPCSRVYFNQLRSLRISDETRFRMFDIASLSINNLREIQSKTSPNFMIIRITYPNSQWFLLFFLHEFLNYNEFKNVFSSGNGPVTRHSL